ncbi:MAG: hypothetical protein ACAH83_07135 [Alphaproteobacteria bacterium]
MQDTTADKVRLVAQYVRSLNCHTQDAQYHLAEKLPLPERLSEIFGWATSPYELVEARERYNTFNMLAYSLAINAKQPDIAPLCLAGGAPGMEGRDIKEVFCEAADALMALPQNKPNPELRKYVEPDETEMAEIVQELKSMGCTMNGTVLAKLPAINP